MKSKHILIAAISILSLAIIFNVQGKSNPSEETKELSYNKIYMIYTDGLYSSGNIMTNLSKENFLGTQCIKGTGVTSWVKGKITRIPVQRVTMIIEFDSLEDFEKSAKKHKLNDYGF